jgi:hypothetical protein
MAKLSEERREDLYAKLAAMSPEERAAFVRHVQQMVKTSPNIDPEVAAEILEIATMADQVAPAEDLDTREPHPPTIAGRPDVPVGGLPAAPPPPARNPPPTPGRVPAGQQVMDAAVGGLKSLFPDPEQDPFVKVGRPTFLPDDMDPAPAFRTADPHARNLPSGPVTPAPPVKQGGIVDMIPRNDDGSFVKVGRPTFLPDNMNPAPSFPTPDPHARNLASRPVTPAPPVKQGGIVDAFKGMFPNPEQEPFVKIGRPTFLPDNMNPAPSFPTPNPHARNLPSGPVTPQVSPKQQFLRANTVPNQAPPGVVRDPRNMSVMSPERAATGANPTVVDGGLPSLPTSPKGRRVFNAPPVDIHAQPEKGVLENFFESAKDWAKDWAENIDSPKNVAKDEAAIADTIEAIKNVPKQAWDTWYNSLPDWGRSVVDRYLQSAAPVWKDLTKRNAEMEGPEWLRSIDDWLFSDRPPAGSVPADPTKVPIPTPRPTPMMSPEELAAPVEGEGADALRQLDGQITTMRGVPQPPMRSSSLPGGTYAGSEESKRTALLAQLALAGGIMEDAGYPGIGKGFIAAGLAHSGGYERYLDTLQDRSDDDFQNRKLQYQHDLAMYNSGVSARNTTATNARQIAKDRHARLMEMIGPYPDGDPVTDPTLTDRQNEWKRQARKANAIVFQEDIDVS